MKKKMRVIGQSTAEYATLFAIILGAIMVMQLYVKRAMQAKQRDAFMYMAKNLGVNEFQYEPYYVDKKINQAVRSNTNTDLAENVDYYSYSNTVVDYKSDSYDREKGWDNNIDQYY